jgi:hypothetical protein
VATRLPGELEEHILEPFPRRLMLEEHVVP